LAKKVFISHASEDLAIVKRFVDLLEDGMGFTRPEVVCSSLPGYGFALGGPFDDDIRDHIESADVVLALVSPSYLNSQYCMGEIGIAWGLRKDIVPLLLPNISTGQVRGPLLRLNLSRLNQRDTLNVLWEQFGAAANGNPDLVRWEDRRDRFLAGAHLEATPEIWPDRGFWNGRVVDGTLYIATDLKTRGLRSQVLDALENERPLPPHLFYITDLGAERWFALAEDPTFVAYQDSMELVYSAADEITGELVSAAGSKNIDYVSLGPGDGRKDVVLLRSLIQTPGPGGEIIYYPYDISVNMIAKTVGRVREDRAIRGGLAQAKAVVGDFDSLPIFKPVYQYREGPNVISLLGNLLGNISDDFGFLKRLHDRAMFRDDLLVLEVRLRSEESRSSLRDMERNDWHASHRFDFGPLELLGITFDADKLRYNVEPDRGTIRGSDTIVARYLEATVRNRTFHDIDLSYVHRYEQQTLLREISRAGFRVVHTWRSPRQHNLWVLAQKVAVTP
jgi:uncharacterized SAM-dependent methyltransferase